MFRGGAEKKRSRRLADDLAAMGRLSGKENRKAAYVEEAVRGVWVDAPMAGNGRKKVG